MRRSIGTYLVEIFDILPPAFRGNGCIQHKQIDLAEVHFDFGPKVLPFFNFADIYCVCLGFAICEVGFCGGECCGVSIDERKTQTMLVTYFGDSESNTTRSTSDESRVTSLENGVEGHYERV